MDSFENYRAIVWFDLIDNDVGDKLSSIHRFCIDGINALLLLCDECMSSC